MLEQGRQQVLSTTNSPWYTFTLSFSYFPRTTVDWNSCSLAEVMSRAIKIDEFRMQPSKISLLMCELLRTLTDITRYRLRAFNKMCQCIFTLWQYILEEEEPKRGWDRKCLLPNQDSNNLDQPKIHSTYNLSKDDCPESGCVMDLDMYADVSIHSLRMLLWENSRQYLHWIQFDIISEHFVHMTDTKWKFSKVKLLLNPYHIHPSTLNKLFREYRWENNTYTVNQFRINFCLRKYPLCVC